MMKNKNISLLLSIWLMVNTIIHPIQAFALMTETNPESITENSIKISTTTVETEVDCANLVQDPLCGFVFMEPQMEHRGTKTYTYTTEYLGSVYDQIDDQFSDEDQQRYFNDSYYSKEIIDEQITIASAAIEEGITRWGSFINLIKVDDPNAADLRFFIWNLPETGFSLPNLNNITPGNVLENEAEDENQTSESILAVDTTLVQESLVESESSTVGSQFLTTQIALSEITSADSMITTISATEPDIENRIIENGRIIPVHSTVNNAACAKNIHTPTMEAMEAGVIVPLLNTRGNAEAAPITSTPLTVTCTVVAI